MDFCMNSRKNHITRWIQLIAGLASCALCLIFAVGLSAEPAEAEDPVGAVFLMVLLFFLGVSIAAYCAFFYIVEARRYRLTPDGILIRYPGGRTAQYAWKDAKSILLADVNPYQRDYRIFDVALRISFENEPDLPINTRFTSGKWRRAEYHIRHFRSIILIEYTPERMRELSAACGQEIIDLRSPLCKEMYPDKC